MSEAQLAAAPIPVAPGSEPNARKGIDLRQLIERLMAANVGATVARGAALSFAINVVSMGLGFLVQLQLARALRPAEYGIYLVVSAWINVAMLAGKLEFDPCAVRYVGAYSGTGRWSHLRGFLRRSHQIVTMASLGVATIVGIGVLLLRSFVPPGQLASYLIGCAILPVSSLLLLQFGCLQGFRRVVRAQAPNLLVRPLLFGVILAVVVYGFGAHLAATQALALQLLTAALALGLSTVFLRRSLPNDVASARPAYDTREWLRTSRGLMVIAGANLLLSSQSDLLIIGAFLGAERAGVYGVASQFAALIGFGVTGVLFCTTPMISSLHAQGDRAGLQRLTRTATRLNMAVSLPILPILVVFGHRLLGLFGPGYVSGYPVLLLLSASVVLASTVGALSGFLLTMTGHQDVAGKVIVGSALLNLALTITLTPAFGPIGTATATGIAGIVRACVLSLVVWRRLGVSILPLATRPFARIEA